MRSEASTRRRQSKKAIPVLERNWSARAWQTHRPRAGNGRIVADKGACEKKIRERFREQKEVEFVFPGKEAAN